MRLRRLRSMGPGELAGRGRQQVWKWIERGRAAAGLPLGAHRSLLRQLEAAVGRNPPHGRTGAKRAVEPGEALIEWLRTSVLHRISEGATCPIVRTTIARRDPASRARLLHAAGSILEGRFDLLGYLGLSFGDPVDWHRDPIHARRAPLRHWSAIDPLDADSVGDSKIVWELNRHQWMVHLGQAYRWTGDESYARAAARHLRDWIGANPPGMGINWSSSLELALRLIAWTWTLLLLGRSPSLTPRLCRETLGCLLAHATHIERYLSTYFSPNTHLLGEALGLFYAGALFPELHAGRRWQAIGARLLVEQSARQVLPDGVYFEQSTCYQRYAADIYLHFLALAARNGIAIPAELRQRVGRMVDFLLALRRPDGTIPAIGDHDGGRLLPFAGRKPDDFRDIFSTAAVLLGRREHAWAAGGLAPESLWLLGCPSIMAFDTLGSSPPPSASLTVFPKGGYAIMRSGWAGDAQHLVFDAGPFGCGLSNGHGHADLLSIQCSVGGQRYLVDPGTYCYTGDGAWRDALRGAAAHSCLIVDGRDLARPAGPFAWKGRPRARLRRWESTAALDIAEGEHDAYLDLPDPVTHRRRVVHVRARYWLVIDELRGEGEHRVELRFQFAAIPIAIDPHGWVRACGGAGGALLVRAFAETKLGVSLHVGEARPIQGWIAPDYGRRLPAPVLVYRARPALPARIVTLLMPANGHTTPPPAVSPIPGVGRGPRGLEIQTPEGLEVVHFHGPRTHLESIPSRDQPVRSHAPGEGADRR